MNTLPVIPFLLLWIIYFCPLPPKEGITKLWHLGLTTSSLQRDKRVNVSCFKKSRIWLLVYLQYRMSPTTNLPVTSYPKQSSCIFGDHSMAIQYFRFSQSAKPNPLLKCYVPTCRIRAAALSQIHNSVSYSKPWFQIHVLLIF